MLDDICNRAVNPKQGPREGSWEDRLDAIKALHARLRAGRPGWGRYALYDLAAMSRQQPAEAEIFDIRPGGFGRKAGRR